MATVDLVDRDPVVSTMESVHLAFAASLHESALPDGFFVALGRPFLESYYAAFCASPYAVALVATIDGAPCGIVVGTIDVGAHYRWVVRHRFWAHARPAATAFARRPMLAVRFARTRGRRYARGAIRLRRRTTPVAPIPIAVRTSVLTHLAVVEARRTNGIGRMLVDAFVARAGALGARRLRVATTEGDGAAAFYRRLGWTPAGSTHNLDGAPFAVFTREL